MDGGGEGYRLMNFSSGRVQDVDEPMIINRMMMLRFRPIAPKPTGADSPTMSRLAVPKVRTKRKYVRVRAAATRKKKNNSHSNSNTKKVVDHDDGGVSDLGCGRLPATLQLLPGSAELDLNRSDVTILEPTPTSPTEDNNKNKNNSEKSKRRSSEDSHVAAVEKPPDLATEAAVETWVRAEGVTAGACMDMAEGGRRGGVGLLCRIGMKDLEEDTCPAFVSDGEDKVLWVNEAYREMVAAAAGKVVVVRLVVEEKLRPYLECCAAFSCWVGLRFRATMSSKWSVIMRVPCDVWKMEEEEGEGGYYNYAWRLDIKLALKLGL